MTPRQAFIFDTLIATDVVLNPPTSNNTPNRPEIVQVWRNYLLNDANGRTEAQALYRAFLAPDPTVSPTQPQPGQLRFDPPKFRYDSANLAPPEKFFPDVGGKKVAAGSYHHLLWTALVDQAAKAGNEAEREHAKQGLRRLYGFGERLRWMKTAVGGDPLAAANRRFMVIFTGVYGAI